MTAALCPAAPFDQPGGKEQCCCKRGEERQIKPIVGGAEADGKIQPSGNPPDMPGQKLESTGSWNQQQGDQIDDVDHLGTIPEQTEDDGTDQTGEEQRRNEEVKTCGVVYTSIEVQPRQKYADDAAKQQKQD